MSKAVLISIHPEWCEKIINGQKTNEVRKTRPKIETPFKCYIYCTGSDLHRALVVGGETAKQIICCNYKTAIPCGGVIGNGKVIGEFICNRIDLLDPNASGLFADFTTPLTGICMSLGEIINYNNRNDVYLWHITNLIIYDKPLDICTFRKWCKKECEICVLDYTHCSNSIPLERPPQSWCYVQERVFI